MMVPTESWILSQPSIRRRPRIMMTPSFLSRSRTTTQFYAWRLPHFCTTTTREPYSPTLTQQNLSQRQHALHYQVLYSRKTTLHTSSMTTSFTWESQGRLLSKTQTSAHRASQSIHHPRPYSSGTTQQYPHTTRTTYRNPSTP